MNSRIESFETLLSRCRLRNPLPADLRARAVRSRKNAKEIFQKAGTYSLMLWLTFRLFMLLRDFGIKATFLQVKVLIGIIAVNAVVTAPAGGYYAVKYIKAMIEPQTEDAGSMPLTPDGVLKDEQAEKTAPASAVYDVGLGGFTGNSVNIGRVERALYSGLVEILGKDRAVYLGSGNRNRVKKIVTGTVQKFGDKYLITAKVVDVETSKVLSVISEKSDETGIDAVCGKIAGKLAESFKKITSYK